MKTEIVTREIIKPSSPTPKSYNLCFMDQRAPPVYIKLYLFYNNSSSDDIENVIAKRSQILKSSLSKVLTWFYSFAGKIRDKITVSLQKDDGVEFLEARVGSNLSDYLEKPIQEMFLNLVPEDFWDLAGRPLLVVQANFFKCGGLAIGMNFSHKVSDAASFTSFINAWADTAIGKPQKIDNPDFSGSLVFPAIKENFLTVEHTKEMVKINNKTKRFLFTAPKIASLQEKATVHRSTRIETITAFLWRIRMKMSIKKNVDSAVSPVLLMPINIRKWLQLPICDGTFGNMVEILIVQNDSFCIELSYLISLLQEQLNESCKAYLKNIDGQQFIERFLRIHKKETKFISKPIENNALMISSWSKFPLYEADFGWGKPTWVANHNQAPYFVFLMDSRDGTGIEAWVSFPEEEMDIFECDEELLTYATPDPSVV